MDHNPPPPPELLIDFDELVPDKIGETVFSKQWLFQSLLSVMQAVEKEKNTTENEVLELDSEVEERICMLWDMSSNKDIAHFLLENRAIEVFLEIINMTVSPRLVEIIVGILGNMACFGDICEHITKNDKLVEQVIQLVGSTDPPILVQVIRLIHVCIMNDTSSIEWITYIKRNKDFIQYLIFILKSSLNGELLKGTLQMIYCVLDKDQALSTEWKMQEVIDAIMDCGKQLLNLNDYKGLDEFWHTLYFLIQQENTNVSMEKNFNSICQAFSQYILKQKENENCLPHPDSFTAVAAAISVIIICISNSRYCDYRTLITDQTLRCIEEMFGAIKKIIFDKETAEKNKSTSKEVISNPIQNEHSAIIAQDLKHLYILHDSLKELSDFVISST